MPTLIAEQPFFDEVSGVPLASGKIYIGTAGGDPVAAPVTIYSDRELSVPLANPQTLDANGRSPNKIWISGTYSMQVNDVLGVQKLQDLDAGVSAAVGNKAVTGVSGTNTILGAAGITEYTDGEVYIFKAANNNTAAVTLNIDSIGAKSIVTDDQQTLIAAAFKANASIMVVYNSTNDNFRWINPSRQFNRWYKGADIASASALTLGGDGNYFDVTGTTTITSIVTRGVGFIVKVHFDAILTLTHHATDLILPNAANITTAPGDEAEFIEYATGDWRLINYANQNGRALLSNLLFDKSLWPAVANAADASHDITASTGRVIDSTGAHVLSLTTELTKQIDVNWAEGDDAGGFPSGLTLTADISYHFFLIGKVDANTGEITGVDAGWDTSLTAANLLTDASDYSVFRRIASFIMDASANIIAFTLIDNFYSFTTPITDVNTTTIGATDTTVVLTVPASVPGLMALLKASATSSSGATMAMRTIGDSAKHDEPINGTYATFVDAASIHNMIVENAAHSVQIENTNTSDDLRIDTLGYFDPRIG